MADREGGEAVNDNREQPIKLWIINIPEGVRLYVNDVEAHMGDPVKIGDALRTEQTIRGAVAQAPISIGGKVL